MKASDFRKLILIFWFSCQSCNCINSTNFRLTAKNFSNLADVAASIVEVDFSAGTTTSNLILPDGSDLNLKYFADELLAKSFGKIASVFRQETPKNLATIRGRKRRCAMFVIDRFEQFTAVYQRMSSKIFRFNGFFLIVLTNGIIHEIDEIFKLMWKLQIYNVNIIHEEEDKSVAVKTFFPFQPGDCNSSVPVLVNRYKNGNFAFELNGFYPEKVKNLHNCTVNVSASNSSQPFIIQKRLQNNSLQLSGQDIKLLKTLQETLNMNINFSFLGDIGYLHDNGSAEGPFRALMDGIADLSISGWLIKSTRSKFFDETTSYTSVAINFVIPPGSPLTSFQKLIFPFEAFSWALIALSLSVGVFVIFVIKCKSRAMQNFIFGARVNDAYLNLFIGFIGGTQRFLPNRNFARFLLVAYLLYCLVIRTLYQAEYFRLMQSSKRNEEFQSIEEMVEKDFKFYVPIGLADIFIGAEMIKNR